MGAGQHLPVAHPVTAVGGDGHSVQRGQLVPEPLGARVEPDPLGAALPEQVHHRQPHRRLMHQPPRQGRELGRAVVRVEAMVVDADRRALRYAGVGRVPDEALVARSGDHGQLLAEVHAHPCRSRRRPRRGRGRVDQHPVAGRETGRERQEHTPPQTPVVQGRVQAHLLPRREGERQVVAVAGHQRIDAGLQQSGPDSRDGLHLIGHHHIRPHVPHDSGQGIQARVEPRSVLRGRRRRGHVPHPRVTDRCGRGHGHLGPGVRQGRRKQFREGESRVGRQPVRIRDVEQVQHSLHETSSSHPGVVPGP